MALVWFKNAAKVHKKQKRHAYIWIKTDWNVLFAMSIEKPKRSNALDDARLYLRTEESFRPLQLLQGV
jgi:hypothetical protein